MATRKHHHRRTGRPDLSEPRNRPLGNIRRLSLRQCARQTADRQKRRPPIPSQRGKLESVQPEDVLPGDIDAKSRSPMDPRQRRAGVRSLPVRRFGILRRRVTSQERRCLESLAGLRGRTFRASHVGLRNIASQRNASAGTGPQHEGPVHLRHGRHGRS